MTLKIAQILNFREFYEKVKDKKLPLKTTYKFTKLFAKLDTELLFYQEQLQKIMDKYGEKDVEGNFVLTPEKTGIMIQKQFLPICQKEMNELHNLDVELDGFSFTLDELEGLEMTIGEMNILAPFIEG